MKYKIEITETLQKTVEIEANNKNEAILKIKHLYKNEEVTLDDTSYIDTKFQVVD